MCVWWKYISLYDATGKIISLLLLLVALALSFSSSFSFFFLSRYSKLNARILERCIQYYKHTYLHNAHKTHVVRFGEVRSRVKLILLWLKRRVRGGLETRKLQRVHRKLPTTTKPYENVKRNKISTKQHTKKLQQQNQQPKITFGWKRVKRKHNKQTVNDANEGKKKHKNRTHAVTLLYRHRLVYRIHQWKYKMDTGMRQRSKATSHTYQTNQQNQADIMKWTSSLC